MHTNRTGLDFGLLLRANKISFENVNSQSENGLSFDADFPDKHSRVLMHLRLF